MTSLVEVPAAGLGEHVDDDVFGEAFGKRPVGRRRPARQMRARQRVAIGDVARLDLPHRRVVVAVQQRLIIAVGRGVPGAELLLVHQPAQEGARLVLCRGEIEDRMADRVHQMEPSLRSRRVLRLVGDLGDVGEIALGEPQDALGIVGARDLLGVPRLVVADIGPAEDVVEHRVLEEFAGEIDGAGGLVGVDDDGLAVGLDLVAAIRPQQRIEPAVVVAKTVAELEAERVVLRFQLLADLVELVPGIGKFLDPDFGEPIGAPVHQLADIAERHRLPFAVDNARLLGDIVPAALLFAGLLGDVADIEQLFLEQERVEQEDHRDVRPGPGLGDRADPGRQAADARQLVIDFDAGLFFVGRRQSLLHVFVECLDERALVQKGERLALRSGRPRTDRGAHRPEPGQLQKSAARCDIHSSHSLQADARKSGGFDASIARAPPRQAGIPRVQTHSCASPVDGGPVLPPKILSQRRRPVPMAENGSRPSAGMTGEADHRRLDTLAGADEVDRPLVRCRGQVLQEIAGTLGGDQDQGAAVSECLLARRRLGAGGRPRSRGPSRRR